LIEERMDINPTEKQRVRREKLAERLMEVFGLEKREEVLEEMRCWLLRSVSECTGSLLMGMLLTQSQC
jgi:sterol 3beta-glucosyltransferase